MTTIVFPFQAYTPLYVSWTAQLWDLRTVLGTTLLIIFYGRKDLLVGWVDA